MKRLLFALLIGCLVAPPASGQSYGPADGCATGQCPTIVSPPPVGPAPSGARTATVPADARAAIVRIVNARGPSRALGTGTLVDAEGEQGLVITCAHLFRDGAGAIQVTFPGGQSFAARLVKIDASADLAALSIGATRVQPITIAQQYPQRGDLLVSCGYGADGRLWCNRGQALGYVSTSGSRGTETLELSGAARFGDSGGPIFDRNYQLVAVLFGTNGRVVDGTFCGRVRQFLRGLSPRFGSRPAAPQAQSPESGRGTESHPPLVDVPPAPDSPTQPPRAGQPPERNRLGKLEGLVARLHDRWQGTSERINGLADVVRKLREAVRGRAGTSPLSPAAADPLGPIAERARPWLSARLAALLISFGVPGGIAGVAAGATVYFVMRRGKRRLQAKLDRLKVRNYNTGAVPSVSSESDDQAVVRHHNRYVPYEMTALDRAWASAHAHIGEKYPGAVPYLKLAEGVKDQLLSGNDEPTLSEGRLS